MHRENDKIISRELPTAQNGSSSQPLQATQAKFKTVTLTEEEFRELLSRLTEGYGLIADAAMHFGVSAQHWGQILRGNKRPGKTVLQFIRAKARLVYDVEMEEVADE